ncbi:DUF2087 domain-containing protein [Paenibacillus antri]|uniref:DUF2087 domain-containing protein n=1 Tax=Paenibacillus antri TaxID=2582848 RepID=A0A5R9G825_9BACL|nr:DUF2087 domain-containing protein [Paenibacillus antri]TLS50230.1 DUF2087 domain-containing protein [Paenibacillus antri]
MDLERQFWNASPEELKRGYGTYPEQGGHRCLVCGEFAEFGRVFPIGEHWYDAEAYMKRHIAAAHKSMFEYLLSLDKKWTGLTDVQREVLQLFYEGRSDADTAKTLGSKPATVRYHRFHLREKEKQAKVFLALMALLDERPKANADAGDSEQEEFVPIHRTATTIDERYAMTAEENAKVLKTYFPYGLEGPLKEFPSKEKRKIAVLRHLMTRFERNRVYSEKEVNAVLKDAFSDYVTLRRYMIEYGFMDRKDDGSEYWAKGEAMHG